tara:strand:+ start:7507 stop:7734 length:228 start_codon:yes stop_codon:yes gene_type:complete
MSSQDLGNIRSIVGSLIEEEGADAVVIIYSKVKKNKTKTFLVPYGNAHTCGALIDYAYENYEDSEAVVEEEESDE